MASLLHVDSSATFMADEVASICPLLTPSPPTNALVNPLPVSEESNFILPVDLATKLQRVEEGADSASSNSSTLAEPACTQLLSGHKQYLHKNEETVTEETGGKTQNLQMTFRNPPENYFFMKWNWPVIRKVSAWMFLAGIMAMIAVVIAMVWKLPKTCNPPTEWYQGKLMYEIFPASFSDSDDDGIGDLKGVALRVDYLSSLGVQAVRLNSIFASLQYPENYNNVTTLTEIAPQIGKLADLTLLVNSLHNENIRLVLDVPIWPLIKRLKRRDFTNGSSFNEENFENDPIEDALTFWANLGVDGFYLKGLELLTNDESFSANLRSWKRVLGWNKILIVNHAVIDRTHPKCIPTVLNNIDLVDVRLEMTGGVEKISEQLESVLNSTLFAKAGNPWVHWSLGNDATARLTNKLPYTNATLGATLLQLMLPGTPSIFYGDEIGLQQISDPHEDRKGLEHLHQLSAMAWEAPNRPFTRKGILPWMHSHPMPINFAQLEIISKMVSLRVTSPSIYVNAINKDGLNKANAEIKYKENDLLVIQRWFPRRKSYVVVSNLGFVHISADLSTLLYGGQVVVGPTASSKIETLSFKEISLWPGESVVVLLD
ncbi:4F2 cell-surface antigen heavy chain-like isoform X2 [Photinus pyralis]|uniref:4F2 cell-surface antigen heavy chain-like isoform X2 n=1 Tax=Photinus pyralis TaxID=7054 RepID=UPI001266F58B|nr:4F2 cell-surface antigen heavy chain-like isoform X2 [Photinus pyralis]